MSIKHKKHIDNTPFDTKRIPPKQNLVFMILAWPFLFIYMKIFGLKIKKVNMKGLKPPFIVLGTHQSFFDFFVTPLCLFPRRANYVSELEGFENYGEWLYRQAGCLGTRKFISDMDLVRNATRIMKRKGILVIYPEARYANVGTSCDFPIASAKLCKLLKVPVVTVNMKGNYLKQPIWNLRNRSGVKLDATITQLLTKDEVIKSSAEDIHKKLSEALSFDEYQYQKEAGIKIKDNFRAEGLHLPLYQCKCCAKEYTMTSQGTKLFCKSCGSTWNLEFNGTLTKDNEIFNIPVWYEWQRENVKNEIEAGNYILDQDVHIEALPNAKNFIHLGTGHIHQDTKGISLTVTNYGENSSKEYHFSPKATFSIHTEYDYRGLGQCITLSTPENTYFIFPTEANFNATKIQFATEYMHQKSII